MDTKPETDAESIAALDADRVHSEAVGRTGMNAHRYSGCMSDADLVVDMAAALVVVRNIDIKSLCKLALRMHGFDRDDVERLVDAAMAKEIDRRLSGGRMIWWKGKRK